MKVMEKSILRWFFILVLSLSLAACFGPKTPQEVTQAFWQAVLNNEVKYAVEYSTLNDAKDYDAFSKNWTGYHASWGRVVIDENRADVVSEFAAPANSGREDRKFVTYLVKQDGVWKVDYDYTKMSVNGGVLGNLFGQLGQLGDELGKQLNSSADRFKQEMDRMSKELEQMAKSFNDQATKSMNEYAEQLQQKLQELEDSINRALKDDNKLSDHDRQVLQVAGDDLERDRQRLRDPSVDSILSSNRNIGTTQQKLDELDSSDLAKYKQEWRDLTREIQDAMQKMLDELSSRLNHQDV